MTWGKEREIQENRHTVGLDRRNANLVEINEYLNPINFQSYMIQYDPIEI
jgi:hypothetical protein